MSTTGLQYDTTNLSHSFYGFASGYRYIIRGYGKTVNGMNLTTDEVVINVDYNVEEIFSKLDLTNIKNKAAVLIDSNIVRADGESKKAVTYIDGEWADLKSNYVIYDGGFLLDGDFSLIIYVKGLTRNIPFFDFYSAYNKDFHGALTYRVGNAADNADGSFYGQFELRITDKNKNGVSTSYVIYTDRIPRIYDSTIVGLCIVRSNGLYSLQMLNMSSTNTTSEEAI